MSPALLELRDLTVRYPLRASGVGRGRSATVVDRVSLRLDRGESLGLVGESGCGKSTLARALTGLVKPSGGEILLDGVDLVRAQGDELRAARRRMSLLPQDPFASLDPRCTALESVVEPLSIHAHLRPRERRLRALVLLEAVGLDPAQSARLPHEFSGGQRQRIALARALALEPEVVLLDEPTSALDVSVQAQVIALLAELQQRFGLAYLFISHDLALVRHLCPRVAVMYFGRVVESSDRDGLFSDPRHPYTRALLACAPTADPEVDRHRPSALLQGEPPSHLAPPSGCAFHPRCPERQRVADDRCAREAPALEGDPRDSSRLKACFLPDPPTPKPEIDPRPRPSRRPGSIDA